MNTMTADDLYRRQREYENAIGKQMESLERRLCEFVDARLPTVGGPQDVRMQCLSMVIANRDQDATVDGIINCAESYSQFVLTGNKPGEA